MAKVYFITALLLLQGCIYVCGSANSTNSTNSTSSTNATNATVMSPITSTSASVISSASAPQSTSQSTPSSVSTSTSPSVSTSFSQSTPPSVSQSTPPSISRSTPPSVSQSTPPSVSQSTPPSVSQSTSPSSSQSTPPSVTTSFPAPPPPPPSSSVTTPPPSTSIAPTTPPPTIGAVVIIFLHIKVSSCQAGHNVTSSSEAMVLKANLTINVKNVYKDKAIVHTVDLINSTCISSTNYVVVYINVTFMKDSVKAGVYIDEVLKAEISDNRLGDLPVSGTQYKVTFTGVILGDHKVKDGECARVCCGAGGPLVFERTCSPTVRCKGIRTTKEEKDHCSGEKYGNTCKDVVCPDPDKACSSLTPSFALLLLLTVASFLKITAY